MFLSINLLSHGSKFSHVLVFVFLTVPARSLVLEDGPLTFWVYNKQSTWGGMVVNHTGYQASVLLFFFIIKLTPILSIFSLTKCCYMHCPIQSPQKKLTRAVVILHNRVEGHSHPRGLDSHTSTFFWCWKAPASFSAFLSLPWLQVAGRESAAFTVWH